MKVLRADDDLGAIGRHALDLVAPFARHLERGLDRLGAGFHQQRLVRAGQRAEFRQERRELVVAEGA